ncbi:transglycosylase domain-containing protein [Alicyclobacillus tolerans]|uniref:transglycosylase domain-containing protein n=1 Tax=Alicyclobacillus tolerans TaxID=90970 RepID=UPI0023516037|nr:transglycosylase domain-containing protein [Alicyclobacillus tolerans]MCF8568104.1 transglycosylase domain-containing protein [Alicyclobacillus tolerans]
MYLNKVFLGENSVGVREAAMRHFGINIKQHPNALTLDEAALLAGLPQAPTAYDPLQHLKAALQRRNQVLRQIWLHMDWSGRKISLQCGSCNKLVFRQVHSLP